MPSIEQNKLSLRLPDNLTMRGITAVQEEVLQSIASNPSVSLDIADDAQLDLSFIQLVEAARIYAGTAGKQLSLSKPASGQVLEVLQRGGFLQDMAAEDAKFWLHERKIQ